MIENFPLKDKTYQKLLVTETNYRFGICKFSLEDYIPIC